MPPKYQHDDAFDEEGLLKDGQRLRTSMFAMDSLQRSVAVNVTDAFGESSDAALNRPGGRFSSDTTNDSDRARKRAETYEFADAERSAEYRGGLQVGDTIDLSGKRYTVSERGRDGRTRLIVDKRSAEEAKAVAYETYDAEIQRQWQTGAASDAVAKEGDACTTADGRRGRVVRRNMALVCEPIQRQFNGSEDSLLELVEQHRSVTDAAYSDYDRDIEKAWRS